MGPTTRRPRYQGQLLGGLVIRAWLRGWLGYAVSPFSCGWPILASPASPARRSLFGEFIIDSININIDIIIDVGDKTNVFYNIKGIKNLNNINNIITIITITISY